MGKKKIRLLAWFSIPKRSDPNRLEEPFDCHKQCLVGNKWKTSQREALRCTRIDLPPVEWGTPPDQLRRYMGRAAAPELQGEREYEGLTYFNWDQPPESLKDGCPGGWVHNEFIASLSKYLRQDSEQGGWSANRFLEMTEDRVVIAATAYYEYESRRFRNYQLEMIEHKQKQLIEAQPKS